MAVEGSEWAGRAEATIANFLWCVVLQSSSLLLWWEATVIPWLNCILCFSLPVSPRYDCDGFQPLKIFGNELIGEEVAYPCPMCPPGVYLSWARLLTSGKKNLIWHILSDFGANSNNIRVLHTAYQVQTKRLFFFKAELSTSNLPPALYFSTKLVLSYLCSTHLS